MADKEDIDLGLGAPTPVSSDAVEAQQVNQIHASVGDVTGMFAPGLSNEDFVSQLNMVPQEKLIPWEECVLPSRGIYYDWPDGTIKVKGMGQVAEKILSTQRLAQSGQSLEYLFTECCQFPGGFGAEDLLVGDRTFLLYYLRGITHGNLYEFAMTCPNTDCNQVTTHTYDLNDLARTVVWAKPELGKEPFKVPLPYLTEVTGRQVYVGVRFLRSYDTNDIIMRRKARKKMFTKPGGVRTRTPNRPGAPVDPRQQQQRTQELNEALSENMNKFIVSVMDVQDPFQIRTFIERMHATDTSAVREWLAANTPGIDNTVTVECPDCNQEFTVELPITEGFFRPAKQ